MGKLQKQILRVSQFFQILGRVFCLLWKSSPGLLVKMIIVSICSGGIVPVTLVIWKYLINDMGTSITTHEINNVIFWFLLYFVVYSLANVLLRIKEYYQNILASYLNKYTSGIILDKVKQIELKNFDDASIYDKIRKVNEESTGRSMSLLSTITSFIESLSGLIGTISVLASLSVGVMFLCMLVCIPTLVISMKMAVKQYEIYSNRFENLRFIASLKDMVTTYENIKEMKLYRLNDFFKQYILGRYKEYIAEDSNIRKEFGLQLSFTDFVEEVSILGFKIYVVVTVIIKGLTIGDFTLYINAIDNFRVTMATVLNTIASVFEDGLYVQNLFEFLDMESNDVKEAQEKFNVAFQRIEFRNVWFKYPGARDYVLKDISLIIDAEHCYSIVGVNGSGKTTLIKLLLKLYSPDKGCILVDGMDLENIDTPTYQKEIGVVFQDFVKYPLSVGENIGCGDIENIQDKQKIKNAAEKSGANHFIEKLSDGYDTKLQREWSGGTELSLGQWQKLAMSRVFMKEFPVVILDEPTASLDAEAEYEIFKKFRELMEGKTSILIAHRFSTVKLADEIFVLKDGRIIEHGSHQKLLECEGEYANLYAMQAEAYKDVKKI